MRNCTKCHELGEAPVKDKCFECHKEIKKLIEQDRGYHSSSKVKGMECFECHSEHNGREFDMLHFDEKAFDHNNAKFELSGKHASIKCGDCHKSENIKDNELKKRKGTFLGLSQNCLSCHDDYHRGQLSQQCGKCHNTNSFTPADKFNHNTARYKLTGRHLQTDCSKCHKLEGKNRRKFTGLKFDSCLSCHKDVHNSRFGNDCESCHVTASFTILKNKNSFDHNKTDYPLVGRHMTVGCESCHKGISRTRLSHEKCIDCHSDYHRKEFMTGSGIKDCKECHSVDGFDMSSFGVVQHNEAEYKLTGSHLAVSCNECHFTDGRWKFRIEYVNCTDCHNSVHGNSIRSTYNIDYRCKDCHSTGSWSLVSYDHNSSSDFILEGTHLTTQCRRCHFSGKDEEKDQFYFYRLQTSCKSCHDDVHYGQFAAHYNNDCTKCHDFNNWSPSRFNHALTNYRLDGSHINVPCGKCHRKENIGNIQYTKYQLENYQCSDCHS